MNVNVSINGHNESKLGLARVTTGGVPETELGISSTLAIVKVARKSEMGPRAFFFFLDAPFAVRRNARLEN